MHGRCVRIYNMTRALRSRGHEVSILCYQSGDNDNSDAYRASGIDFAGHLTGTPQRQGRSRCFLSPFVYHESLAHELDLIAGDFDVVALINSETLQYSPEARGAKCVWANVADDPILEILRRMLRFSHLKNLRAHLRFLLGYLVYERVFLKDIDLLTFVSETDAASYSRRHWGKNIHFVPNGVDVNFFAPAENRDSSVTSEPTIVFPGNMSHPPNVDAAEFIARRVAPLVWEKRPSARFIFAGCNPVARVSNLANGRIRVTGFVDDMRPFLWDSAGVLIPMRSGTGIKNKLLEAWASGSAVIATDLACQGIPAHADKNLLIGNRADELADRVVAVLDDDELRRDLGAAGRKTVVENMTWSCSAERLENLILSTFKETDR